MSQLACAKILDWVQFEVEAQARALTGAPWTRLLEVFVTKDLDDDKQAFQTFVKLKEPPIRAYIAGVERVPPAPAREVAPHKLDADASNSVYQAFALRHCTRLQCSAADKSRKKMTYDGKQLERLVTRQISNFS